MSTFVYLLLCVSPLLIQNVCSQCIGKRNIIDPACGPPMEIPCPDMCGMPPLMDPCCAGPPAFFPEPAYFPMPCPEIPGPVCGCGSFGWPDYGMPGPCCGGLNNFGAGSIVVQEPAYYDEESACEEAPACEMPFINAVGFGGDAIALALSPLLEAADADVALLMFTKVKTI